MRYLFLITICITICLLVVSTQEHKSKLANFVNQCVAETGVERSTVQNAFQGIFIEDNKFKTFVYCMSKKAGLQNADGHVQLDVFKQNLPDLVDDADEAINLVAKCLGKEGTPEDVALQTFACYYKAKPNRA